VRNADIRDSFKRAVEDDYSVKACKRSPGYTWKSGGELSLEQAAQASLASQTADSLRIRGRVVHSRTGYGLSELEVHAVAKLELEWFSGPG
jgi:hypothetical protein